MILTRYSFEITVFLSIILLSTPVTSAFAQQSEEQIPSWIKNNAEWWADGLIDESSFIQSVQFLIEEGILQISSTEVTTPQEVTTQEVTTQEVTSQEVWIRIINIGYFLNVLFIITTGNYVWENNIFKVLNLRN